MLTALEVFAAIKSGELDPYELLALFEAPPPQDLHNRSSLWPKVRAAWLNTHPLCAACGGNEFLQVHHKMPFHLEPDLELIPLNLITLCEKPSRNCHFVWGHLYNWKNYNSRIEECMNFWADVRRGEAKR